ncbi:Mn2+/Fe2+ NRAMP family transporter [Bradyrhizobium sp. LM2.7]
MRHPSQRGSAVSSAKSAPTLLQRLGPGLITGAADDDPSGIATYSQAGAQFGYGLLWTVFLTTPFMIAIQLVSARIGRVTGKGLAANVMQVAPRWAVLALVFMLVAANTFNIAADIAAMAEALSLVIGGLNHEHALIFAAGSTLLEVFLPYRRYSPVLKFLTLALFAYVATAFTVKIPWSTALLAALWPKANVSADYFLMVVAVLGTTISPYLFFWQASQEVEEMNHGRHDKPLRELKHGGNPEIDRIKMDTVSGMLLSNGIAFFIILTTASVLHANGVTNINSATEAAEALRPLARRFHLCAVRAWHHRHRPIGDPGAGGVGGLRRCRDFRLARHAGGQAGRGGRLLHHHRHRNPDRLRPRLHRHQRAPHAGVERSAQRHRRRSHHGDDDGDRLERRNHGPLQGAPMAGRAGMVRHRADGARRARPAGLVRDRLRRRKCSRLHLSSLHAGPSLA